MPPKKKKSSRWETLKLFGVMQLFSVVFLGIAIVSYLYNDTTFAQRSLEFFAFFFLVGLLISPVIIYLDTPA